MQTARKRLGSCSSVLPCGPNSTSRSRHLSSRSLPETLFVEGTSHIRTDQASQISEGTIKVKAAKFGRVIPMCLALSHEGPRKLVDHRCKRNRRNRSRPENQVIRPRCGRAAALDASARKGVCQGRPLALGVWELSDSRNLYPSGFGGFHISVCNLCGACFNKDASAGDLRLGGPKRGVCSTADALGFRAKERRAPGAEAHGSYRAISGGEIAEASRGPCVGMRSAERRICFEGTLGPHRLPNGEH